MRHLLASIHLVGGLYVLGAGAASAQEPAKTVELEASWFNGESLVQIQSHYRIEQVGVELAGLSKTQARVFQGKIGPCAKRVVFKYPGADIPDGAYFFANNRMIELLRGKDRAGRSYSYQSGKYPTVDQLLSEVKPSGSCRQ